jgi:hypothetical protein
MYHNDYSFYLLDYAPTTVKKVESNKREISITMIDGQKPIVIFEGFWNGKYIKAMYLKNIDVANTIADRLILFFNIK